VEVTDITAKVLAKEPHVLTIERISARNGRQGFTGVHSRIAPEGYIAQHPGARVEYRNKVLDQTSGVYEAEPVIIMPDGTEYIKLNNRGKSTFFPDEWDREKILSEVEYAIRNNHGRDLTSTASNEFYGFSSDGKVEIHFYLGSDGSINSFFPKKR
jgi:hypothetical protein